MRFFLSLFTPHPANYKHMKTLCLILAFIPAYICAQIGEGIVNINFNEHTKLEFYSNSQEKTPVETVEFHIRPESGEIGIKDYGKHEEWLHPEALWLEYEFFFFRCSKKDGDYYEVIVNQETSKKLWLKKSEKVVFKNWGEFLKSVLSIERIGQQAIKSAPDDNSKAVEYQGEDFFNVTEMKGNWVKIVEAEVEEEILKPVSGWIKWTDGKKLLVKYSLIM